MPLKQHNAGLFTKVAPDQAGSVKGPPQETTVEEQALKDCQELIGYTFRDPSLLAKALTHSSVAATRVESNERLEFLGDAVLGLSVCAELYNQYDDLLEGEMTSIKSAVVSRLTCAKITRKLDIGRLLSTGKGVPTPVGLPGSVAAAVFEAIIGAIYIDGGFEPARKFVLQHTRPFIDEAIENEHRSNYKSLLQQYVQRKHQTTPEYIYLDEKGPDHDKCFEVSVGIEGRQFPSAWGKSKKEAEQQAAMKALIELGLINHNKK